MNEIQSRLAKLEAAQAVDRVLLLALFSRAPGNEEIRSLFTGTTKKALELAVFEGFSDEVIEFERQAAQLLLAMMDRELATVTCARSKPSSEPEQGVA